MRTEWAAMVWRSGAAMLLCAAAWSDGTPLVQDGSAVAVVVIADDAAPIAVYAADEFAAHVGQATGVRLPIRRESDGSPDAAPAVYIGNTRAAEAAAITPDSSNSEAHVIRTVGGDLYIVGNDGPGDPLSPGHAYSGTLWGVYEILERDLGVRWLWPGELGIHVPTAHALTLPAYDETGVPRFNRRHLRPSLGLSGFAQGDERLGFSPQERERYAHAQSVFLRRHRMGRSADSYHAQRSFGSGHAFGDWWDRFGESHPEWFQLLPDGRRGPKDLNRLHDVSMCVSNPEFHRKIIELWEAERATRPGEPLNIGLGENDTSAQCVCDPCRAWDGPAPDMTGLPDGLERSFLPVQAGTRYARFAQAVYKRASAVDPDVKVHMYAYLNYFWAPSEDVELHPNVAVGFVPWFRWAGWFPRTDEEQAWIKEQWLGWQRTGASVFYRPNWFLDGYTMPLVYMRQFADAFQFYARHGMSGTDFDSLQGQWAAQGPNLYVLARLHVRPEAPVETLLDEYYAAFGPASNAIRDYFSYWENYAHENRENAAHSIQSRRGGHFRRYALYAQVADELYPPAAFAPALAILDRAEASAGTSPDPLHGQRVAFVRAGLMHALACIDAARVMNAPTSSAAEQAAALAALATFRGQIERLGIANMDRAAIIETDSWQDKDGFSMPWPSPDATR